MVKIISIILVFGLIVFIHEFGHFIVARLNKVKVNEFSIGMGPAISTFGKGETKYALRMFPIGGYCMMEGQLEESEDPNAFSNKKPWQRLAILFAGPCFNFILAFVLAIVVCHYSYIDPPTILEVEKDSAAYEAGIQPGDTITHLNGDRIYNFREISLFRMMADPTKPVEVTIDRNGEVVQTTVLMKYDEKSGSYMFGIRSDSKLSESFSEEVYYGALEVRLQIKSVFMTLGSMFRGKFNKDDLSGPVGIANMMSDVIDEAEDAAEESGSGFGLVLLNIVNFVVLLSANLGVMNLLPIPALDGGRILLVMFEAVTRKKVPADKELIITGIGAAILIVLMIFVLFNDIGKVMGK